MGCPTNSRHTADMPVPHSLQKAAVQEQRWDLAEQAALNLADCHGDTLDGQSAASAVILAQSYAAVAYFQHLYLDACASSDLEALLLRQKDALKVTAPGSRSSAPSA